MHIIEDYIQKLIINLPKGEKTEDINIVLDGGIFNGSYLIGALYFLKELEKKHYIKIHKVSCCSISSVCILLYFADALDLMPELYNIILKQFKEKHNLNVFKLCFDKIRLRIKPMNEAYICKRFNNSVYISYHDIIKGKKIIKSKFKTLDCIFSAIYKSCFVPFIADGNIVYKNRYCDGVNPYILPNENNRKTLYLDLFGSDKINYLLSVKNEKNNFHRILSGLLDIHLFYIKQNQTQMCSYVNNWSLYKTFYNRILKLIVEKIVFYSVYLLYHLKRFIPDELYESIIIKMLAKIIKELYFTIIDYYCF